MNFLASKFLLVSITLTVRKKFSICRVIFFFFILLFWYSTKLTVVLLIIIMGLLMLKIFNYLFFSVNFPQIFLRFSSNFPFDQPRNFFHSFFYGFSRDKRPFGVEMMQDGQVPNTLDDFQSLFLLLELVRASKKKEKNAMSPKKVRCLIKSILFASFLFLF